MLKNLKIKLRIYLMKVIIFLKLISIQLTHDSKALLFHNRNSFKNWIFFNNFFISHNFVVFFENLKIDVFLRNLKIFLNKFLNFFLKNFQILDEILNYNVFHVSYEIFKLVFHYDFLFEFINFNIVVFQVLV